MLRAEKLAAVLVCLGWMVRGDNKQFSDSPLGFSFLSPSPTITFPFSTTSFFPFRFVSMIDIQFELHVAPL